MVECVVSDERDRHRRTRPHPDHRPSLGQKGARGQDFMGCLLRGQSPIGQQQQQQQQDSQQHPGPFQQQQQQHSECLCKLKYLIML